MSNTAIPFSSDASVFQNRPPRFAVLLAAFNGAQWIEGQLKSILRQEGVQVDIFVSIDLSSDNTLSIVRDICDSEGCIHVLDYGERFGRASRNFFRIFRDIDFSKFDFVSLADQDDIWLSNKLLLASHMLSKSGAAAYSSNVTAFWPDGRQTLIKKSQMQEQWDFLFEAAGPGCTYVISKELACAVQDLVRSCWDQVQQVGFHDWFIYAFARANGYKWVIDDFPRMLYRQHANNEVGANIGWRAFSYRIKRVLSGWGLKQSTLIAHLVGLEGCALVQRWFDGSRLGMFSLACHSWKCRRRLRDKFLFALSCLAMFIVGNRPS